MISATSKTVPRTPRWSRATVPAIIGAAALIILMAVLSVDTHTPFQQPVPVNNQSLVLSGWKLSIGDERVRRGAQNFSGKVALNGIAYIPAGANFEIEVDPGEIQGALTDASTGSIWTHEGGDIAAPSRTASGWKQTCRAPNQPGLYHLTWMPQSETAPKTMPPGTPALALDERRVAVAALPAVPGGLDVLILAEAQFHPQSDRTSVRVNGKPIGNYLDPKQSPVRRVKENAAGYQIPRFFAILTPETSKLHLGEDFDLEQLIAFKDYHGPDGKKVFTTQRHTDLIPICPALIQKLVKLRERLREKGVKVTRFWVTSGFRTPEYNKQIGGAAYSRHCYGDAVDICIDEDGDHKMDDLNGDGRVDKKDGIIIGNACRELELEGAVVPGGIGVYEWDGDDSVKSHVHIDCRGYISRWGQIGAGRGKKSFVWWPKAEFQEDDGE